MTGGLSTTIVNHIAQTIEAQLLARAGVETRACFPFVNVHVRAFRNGTRRKPSLLLTLRLGKSTSISAHHIGHFADCLHRCAHSEDSLIHCSDRLAARIAVNLHKRYVLIVPCDLTC